MMNKKIISIDQWKTQNIPQNLYNPKNPEIGSVVDNIEYRPKQTEDFKRYEDDSLSGMLIW